MSARREARALARRRGELGVSRPAMAARLRVNYSTLWRWEHGQMPPRRAQLVLWRQAVRRMERDRERREARRRVRR